MGRVIRWTMPKISLFLIILIITLSLIFIFQGINAMDDCIVVKGVWLNQTLHYGYLHYSFEVQGKEYNYVAVNEYFLRDDLKDGDKIKIKMCWNDGVNGFLTKGIEKWQE